MGAAQALLIIWLAGGLLALGPVPRLAETAQTSTAVRGMNARPAAADRDRRRARRACSTAPGLPEVFVGFDPLPRPAVELPEDATAQAIARLASVEHRSGSSPAPAATSRRAAACVVARDAIVTNAHVVAGARRDGVRVIGSDGDQHDATVVLFDPDLDRATLRVGGREAQRDREEVRDVQHGDVEVRVEQDDRRVELVAVRADDPDPVAPGAGHDVGVGHDVLVARRRRRCPTTRAACAGRRPGTCSPPRAAAMARASASVGSRPAGAAAARSR